MTSVNAPGSPISPEDGSGVWWAPESPSEGILERLRGFQPADDEWWHEHRRNVCRAFLGTKLNWKPGAPGGTVKVASSDMASDLHRLMLDDLREQWPWTDVLDVLGALLGGKAGQRFGREAVKLEWADCLALGAPYTDVDKVAEAVHDCRRRDERAKVIRHMLGVAHDPEAVERDCERLREVR